MKRLLGTIALVTMWGLASAEAGEATALEEAHRLHLAGEVETAGAAYVHYLETVGPHPDVYFNLGLIYRQQGRLAEALLCFERSALLDRQSDVLDLVAATRGHIMTELLKARTGRGVTQGEPTRLVWWRFFHAISATTITWMGLIAWNLAFVLWWYRRRLGRGVWRDLSAVVAVLALLVALGALSYRLAREHLAELVPAVVIHDREGVRDAPSNLGTLLDEDDYFDGALVEVLARREGWVQLRLANGHHAWAPESAVAPLRVPD